MIINANLPTLSRNCTVFMKKRSAIFVLGFSVLVACQKSDKDAFDAASGKDSTKVHAQVSSELVSEIIKSIPSPVEMSSLIREVEHQYSAEILNKPENVSNYTSNFKKAVNIGIYGTDLGYINIYNEKQDAITYLNSMTKLAEDLKIGQFFDYHTIKRLATNSSNLDSLLYITTNNYDKMNAYLQEQKRGNLSIVMLTGGWLEALHLSAQVAKKDKNEKLFQRIGDQKKVLDLIMMLLDFYSTDPNAADLLKSLKLLKERYDKIEIITVYKEPTVQEINGVLMVTDNSTSEIKINYEDIVEIAKIVGDIRAKLVE